MHHTGELHIPIVTCVTNILRRPFSVLALTPAVQAWRDNQHHIDINLDIIVRLKTRYEFHCSGLQRSSKHEAGHKQPKIFDGSYCWLKKPNPLFFSLA